MTNIDNGFWVFGYGSLVWQPGFDFAEREIARMDGFSRSFCMWSIHHRGTEADPGLVLALDAAPGSCCDGVAFFVPPETAQQTIDYLRDRELVSAAYLEQVHPAKLRDGRVVDCVSYVVDRDHVQYCGGLSLERQAEVIAKAVGGRGPNTEYLVEVNRHLGELGLPDPDLEWLTQRVLELSVTA
ncbi:gamma-glutamylcyclotransferase [Neptunicoccus sediminis]|uniref:gamma-glutamylcyclotransferase n=1 Tax=Neptunicoccus sediminis TaxID=1892596 RepID=UPI000A76FE8C